LSPWDNRPDRSSFACIRVHSRSHFFHERRRGEDREFTRMRIRSGRAPPNPSPHCNSGRVENPRHGKPLSPSIYRKEKRDAQAAPPFISSHPAITPPVLVTGGTTVRRRRIPCWLSEPTVRWL